MLSLLGLKDDYTNDGRVLIEGLDAKATPRALRAHRQSVRRLGAAYEQLNAPFGEFALETLKASTAAIKSTDESKYSTIEHRIADLTDRRDALAERIKSGLNAAAFAGRPLDERTAKAEIARAHHLIQEAADLAASS